MAIKVTRAQERQNAARRLALFAEWHGERWIEYRVYRDAAETGEHCAHVAAWAEASYRGMTDRYNEARAVAIKTGAVTPD